MPVTEQISRRQWNRTLLHRQHLLERVEEDAIEILDRCVGLQAQDPRAPFFGLLSRIEGFDSSELDDLLTEREVVRIALLRSTLFVVDAEDARWIRPLAQPVLDAELRRNHASKLVTATAEQVLADADELLAGRELRGAELGAALATRHPDEQPTVLTAIARCGLPLVQVPPRGLFRGKQAVTYQRFDDWVGPGEPAIAGDEARKDLIRLYLRGFGPATVQGIQTWCGLTGLRPLVVAMEADWELARLSGPDGEDLYDLEGLDIVDDGPVPPRLVAPFDNVLVAQADRRRIADEEVYRRTVTANGASPGFVLVDGFLAGTWRVRNDGTVGVEYLREVSAKARRDVDAEVDRVETFVG